MASYIGYTAFADVSLSACRHLETPAIHPAPLARPFSKGLHFYGLSYIALLIIMVILIAVPAVVG